MVNSIQLNCISNLRVLKREEFFLNSYVQRKTYATYNGHNGLLVVRDSIVWPTARRATDLSQHSTHVRLWRETSIVKIDILCYFTNHLKSVYSHQIIRKVWQQRLRQDWGGIIFHRNLAVNVKKRPFTIFTARASYWLTDLTLFVN